jgi:plasmid stabilization system protein ParE
VNVEFVPEAEDELGLAADFYERRRMGQGTAFRDAVAQAVLLIAEYPEVGSPLIRTVRRLTVSGFPFVLVYVRTSDAVRIIAVAHTSRRPTYWLERVQD